MSNGISVEKDPTKSISWLSLKEHEQNRVIELYAATLSPDTDQDKAKDLLERRIHELLGARYQNISGNSLVTKGFLQALANGTQGDIFDTIREYLTKYYTISEAAKSIYKQNQRHEQPVPVKNSWEK